MGEAAVYGFCRNCRSAILESDSTRCSRCGYPETGFRSRNESRTGNVKQGSLEQLELFPYEIGFETHAGVESIAKHADRWLRRANDT